MKLLLVDRLAASGCKPWAVDACARRTTSCEPIDVVGNDAIAIFGAVVEPSGGES